ncbi:hypothetical protein G6F68_013212 [Rhizopus microsporus]|nr:hypothetical protein G6F68_013212 [Rhizopus microsporus]
MYRSSLETVYPKGLHGKTVTYRNNFQTILESSSIEPSFDTDVHMDYEYTATDDQANEQTSEPGSEDDSVVDSDSDSDVEIIEEVECLRLKLQCCYPPISHDNTTTSTGNIGAV